MPAHIKTETLGTTAFTPDGRLAMNFGRPSVSWTFQAADLADWLTTLEETIDLLPRCHHRSLNKLYCCLKAAHNRHLTEHAAIVTDAPSEDDLMEYLVAYAAAMNHG